MKNIVRQYTVNAESVEKHFNLSDKQKTLIKKAQKLNKKLTIKVRYNETSSLIFIQISKTQVK